ncbi:MAG: hypothetical protein GX664_00640 [Bacteroidales bacterium]|nr:hypothetical protein [Bacteroidales bacterium]
MKTNLLSFIKPMILTLVLVMSMAVSCPGPDIPPTPPTPSEEISDDLKAFLLNNDIGLYLDNDILFTYNDLEYQTAWNADNDMFRIQSDDQHAYLNITKNSIDSIASFTINYKSPSQNESNMLILRLRRVKIMDSKAWWWNESLKIGIITPHK